MKKKLHKLEQFLFTCTVHGNFIMMSHRNNFKSDLFKNKRNQLRDFQIFCFFSKTFFVIVSQKLK